MAGKIDKILTDGANGLIVDHKTTSLDPFGDDYYSHLKVDTQSRQYAALAILNGHPLLECMHDVVRKPTIRPKKMESMEDYTQRCIDWCCDGMDDHYRRISTTYTAQDVADYLCELAADAQLMRAQQLAKHHPKSRNSCFDYNRPCDYFGLCHEGLDVETHYVTQESRHAELELQSDLQILTYSRHKCWTTCAKKHDYQYNQALKPIDWVEGEPLALGTAWHEVMDTWWGAVCQPNCLMEEKS
jgi:hypothetical protein